MTTRLTRLVAERTVPMGGCEICVVGKGSFTIRPEQRTCAGTR
jgi:hypothetical protein